MVLNLCVIMFSGLLSNHCHIPNVFSVRKTKLTRKSTLRQYNVLQQYQIAVGHMNNVCGYNNENKAWFMLGLGYAKPEAQLKLNFSRVLFMQAQYNLVKVGDTDPNKNNSGRYS